MSRLTERQSAGYDLIEMKGAWCDNYCGQQSKATCRDCAIWKAIQKLAYYEGLEEQLEELFGGKLPLDKVVETLKRTVQNGEEKLDYARILTNTEAEKWDKWKDLEEQGRLIELPCKVGDTVYVIENTFGNDCTTAYIAEYELTEISYDGRLWTGEFFQFGKEAFVTKEEAEAKLKEFQGE